MVFYFGISKLFCIFVVLSKTNSNNQIKSKVMKPKTEKIRVTVTTEEVKELEISFPYYTKDTGIWCKFFSRSAAMWVCDYSFEKQIKYSNCGVPDGWLTFDPITEEEFNEKFNEVMNALIDINNEKTI